HSNLGNALYAKMELDTAIDHYRKAIEIDPNFALAHHNLGNVLRDNGQFTEALDAFRRFQELASQHPGWKHLAATRVREPDALLKLETRLPAVLSHKVKIANGEQLAFAVCCRYKRFYDASARFSQEAFIAQPNLVVDPTNGNRYNAACAAALAAAGKG